MSAYPFWQKRGTRAKGVSRKKGPLAMRVLQELAVRNVRRQAREEARALAQKFKTEVL